MISTQAQQLTAAANDSDVLCGRGGLSNKHPGNRMFRRLVNANKPTYQKCLNPAHKQLLVISIIKAIQRHGGRFVRKQGQSWTEIPHKDACVKTSQALRENDTPASSDSETSTKAKAVCAKKRKSPKKSPRAAMDKTALPTPAEWRTAMHIPSPAPMRVPSSFFSMERDELDSSRHSVAEVSVDEGDDEDLCPLELSDNMALFPEELDEFLMATDLRALTTTIATI